MKVGGTVSRYTGILSTSLVKQLRVHDGLAFLQSLRLLLMQFLPQDLGEGNATFQSHV